MDLSSLLEIITQNFNTPILIVIIVFSAVNYSTYKFRGWIFIALAWFINLIYLYTESFWSLAASNLGKVHFQTTNFSAFLYASFFLLYWNTNKHHPTKLFKLIPIIILIYVAYLFSVIYFTGDLFPKNGDLIRLIPSNMILALFSFASIFLSGNTLKRFFQKLHFEKYNYIYRPWIVYGLMQLIYPFIPYFKEIVILSLFFFAFILKTFIGIGLILFFKFENEERAKQAENNELDKKKLRMQKNQLLAFSWFAHELKNPVLGIRNLAHTINNELMNNNYHKIKGNIQSLIKLTDIQVSVVESVKIASEPNDEKKIGYFSVNEILDSAIESLKRIIQFRPNDIFKQYSGNLQVCVMRESLQQVFINIIKNALEAVQEQYYNFPELINQIPYRIFLTTEKYELPKNKYVLIRIVDFGPGIKEDILENIFEPYFSTKQGINRGLGLWVVRNFVESFGGFVKAKSPLERINRGTRFDIFLPRVMNDEIKPIEFWTKVTNNFGRTKNVP